ncbi:MAG TPA: Ku protein, partial [Terriglobales bacterium]|nr:Ku protein [Terriglobales bacterium]
GSINFGLVTIPIKLYSAEAPSRLSFDLLDKRNFARIRYRRVNEKTGEEVPWEQIVKGYQYEKGEYVVLSDTEIQQANVEATQSIDIRDFVDAGDISPMYYDKPYYLEPLKNGRRPYALLREVMNDTGKAGVAKVVLRTRQHLAVLLTEGPLLVLNLLRFPYEFRDASGLDVPASEGKKASVTKQEIQMAERLVETMVSDWNPEKYRDEYRDDLLRVIENKIKSGKTKAIETGEGARRRQPRGKVVDIMHLLRQSVKEQSKKEEGSHRRRAS